MEHRFVAELIDVSALIQQEQTLEDGLRDLARMTANALGAGRCSVMLLTEIEGMRKLRVCFRELAAAGFGPSAIIAVSSQVLGELNNNLRRHQSRARRGQG